EKGYGNATIEEIAKLAGVAKGSIYLYFPTKDDLYLSLMIPVLEEIKRSLSDFQDQVAKGQYQTCNAIIIEFYNHYKRIYRYDPDGIRIIQAFQQGDLISAMSRKTREELNRVARGNFRMARTIIDTAMKRKAIVKMNPVQLSDIFWATFIGVVQLEESKFRATQKNHLEETLKSSFAILAQGLCLPKVKGLRK
ncbi:MAG: hypothetical protein A3K30_01485, partial [Deltaproteobacteria bacterium RBG_13_51_10]